MLSFIIRYAFTTLFSSGVSSPNRWGSGKGCFCILLLRRHVHAGIFFREHEHNGGDAVKFSQYAEGLHVWGGLAIFIVGIGGTVNIQNIRLILLGEI